MTVAVIATPDPLDAVTSAAVAAVTEIRAAAAEPATLTAVRKALGRRRPPGAASSADPVDRLDLLVEALAPDTAALTVLWLNGTRRRAEATRTAYADDLLRWAEYGRAERGHDRLDLATLTRADVTMWLGAEQAAGRAASSIARRLATLSSLYRYAASWGLPVRCPVSDDDHRPRVTRGRSATSARVLTADEVAAMLGQATDVRDALVVGLLFTDALRVSEIAGANVDDVSTAARRLWLTVTRKGGDRARVPLDPAVAELLDAYLAARPAWTGSPPPALLLDNTGDRLDRFDVGRILRRLARRAGIADPDTVGPHSLRASAITDQVERGRPVTEVQGLAGHHDLTTTMRYVERRDADERNAAMSADLARVLSAVPAPLRGH